MAPIPVIIPAAGIGSRMAAACAKQYLKLGNKTVLEHSIEVFLHNPRIASITLALHPNDTLFNTLAMAKHPRINVVVGGNERVDSVLNALRFIANKISDNPEQSAWVMVHDAARPCLQQSDLDKLIDACMHDSNSCGGILAVPVADTIKQQASGANEHTLIDKTIDRTLLWQAQTPQMFKSHELLNAIEHALSAEPSSAVITDEASAMELAAYKVQLVEGQSSNIKITRPSDLALAQFYLSTQERDA